MSNQNIDRLHDAVVSLLFHCRRLNSAVCRSPSINNVSDESRINSTIQPLPNTIPLADHIPSPTIMTTIGEFSQSSVDDIGSTDDMTIDQPGCDVQIQLSKKAMHQRDADENLFLRFLELDPPDETLPPPPQTPTVDRRKSMFKTSAPPPPSIVPTVSASSTPGRTPFTITKKLMRTADKGFGFSIVWTHPPRIEKVEPTLSADRCGICPGDYVIFVDKHNVVTMPEMDILNLIRSQGNTLVLEIFRRSSAGIDMSMSNITSNSTKSRVPSRGQDDDSNYRTPQKSSIVSAFVAAAVPVPLTTHATLSAPRSSNLSPSLDSVKKRLRLPSVTFSKDVSVRFCSRQQNQYNSF